MTPAVLRPVQVPAQPTAMELAPGPGAMRAGSRWVPDTFVPWALGAAVQAVAEVMAADVVARGRHKQLDEKGTRKWLGSHRSEALAVASAVVQDLWESLGLGGECPLKVLGFGTTLARKHHCDDLVLRYEVGGNHHKMWINHKLVKSEPTGRARVGSIRSVAAAALGEKISRWEHLVPSLLDALDSGRHLASLVLVVHDRGDSVDVMCYEPFTVFAYRDRTPVAGLLPDAWPVHDDPAVAGIYARENSLVQACHREAQSLYRQAGPALVRAGVGTSEVVRLACGRMLEQDAHQRRQLAVEGERRLAEYVAGSGYVPHRSEGGAAGSGANGATRGAAGLGLVPAGTSGIASLWSGWTHHTELAAA